MTFLAASQSVFQIKEILEKGGEIILNWKTHNTVTYNISKTEAILISKTQNQKLAKKLTNMELRFGNQLVWFNKKST